ncbi:MAG: hypothetical protein RL086_999, partial [Bacteroidota bacterium]|jgi:hypothetical protein
MSKIKPVKKNDRLRLSFFKKNESKKQAKIQTMGLIQKAKILDRIKNIRLILNYCKKDGQLGPSISLPIKY